MKKGGKLGDDCELTPTVASGVSETYTPFTSHKPRTKQGGKLSSSSSRSSSKKKKGGGGGGQQRLPSRVGAGKFFSAVLMASSTVWTFGNNDYGQLGQVVARAHCPSLSLPLSLPHFLFVSHTLFSCFSIQGRFIR